ncbi:hypothetical protein [Pseudomonas sp. McL0111]|uniref:hypothetical protein n=1 Tax=Pseudomonas sp. McL0111 TaxID=3457357 RepID=UPI00403EBC33
MLKDLVATGECGQGNRQAKQSLPGQMRHAGRVKTFEKGIYARFGQNVQSVAKRPQNASAKSLIDPSKPHTDINVMARW